MMIEHSLTAKERSKGGKAQRKPYRFGMDDIAKATGRAKGTIRNDRQKGTLDFRDLGVLAGYVNFHAKPKEISSNLE